MIELGMGSNFVDVALRRIVDLASLNKDELYPYLSDGYVADVWWDLPSVDREYLARNIITWWSAPLDVTRYRFYDETMGEWIERKAVCGAEAIIRFSIISGACCDDLICAKDEYYELDHSEIWREFGADPCFHLPCRLVGVFSETFGHAIVGLQIGQPLEEFNNWIFFNYWEIDIQPGSGQMPSGARVKIRNSTNVHVSWGSATTLMEWYIE